MYEHTWANISSGLTSLAGLGHAFAGFLFQFFGFWDINFYSLCFVLLIAI